MKISPKQNRLIHAALRHLGLSDDEYRTILARVAHVSSATELDHQSFEALMAFFEWLGFNKTPRAPSFGKNRAGMASPGQVQLIRELWHEYTRGQAGAAELDKWLAGKWHASSLRFLTKADAQKAITAVFAMKRRAA